MCISKTCRVLVQCLQEILNVISIPVSVGCFQTWRHRDGWSRVTSLAARCSIVFCPYLSSDFSRTVSAFLRLNCYNFCWLNAKGAFFFCVGAWLSPDVSWSRPACSQKSAGIRGPWPPYVVKKTLMQGSVAHSKAKHPTWCRALGAPGWANTLSSTTFQTLFFINLFFFFFSLFHLLTLV